MSRPPCSRCAALQAENEQLRAALGVGSVDVRNVTLRRRWPGMQRKTATVLLRLYDAPATSHFVANWALRSLLDHGEDSARKTLQVHICRIRRLLGSGAVETLDARSHEEGGYRITDDGRRAVYAALHMQEAA